MNNLINYMVDRKTVKKNNVTIGIPRALVYHEHGKLWENFFTMLGCNVIVSQHTNRSILDEGVKSCSNETCLPVKVMAGHVLSLVGKSDIIFIPRYSSTNVHELCCPKLCALPDMVKLRLKKRINVMEVAIDFNNGLEKTENSLSQVSKTLDIDENTVRSAFYKAVKNRMRADMEAASELPDPEQPAIAVLGHPYMINDSYISMDIIKKLNRYHFHALTPADLDYTTKRSNAYPYQGRQFYEIGLDNLGSAFTYAKLSNIKGIIYITPFSCGIDSLVTEMIEQHLKATGVGLPYMKVTVDEHTGEAGFDTRLEAFLDMIGG